MSLGSVGGSFLSSERSGGGGGGLLGGDFGGDFGGDLGGLRPDEEGFSFSDGTFRGRKHLTVSLQSHLEEEGELFSGGICSSEGFLWDCELNSVTKK